MEQYNNRLIIVDRKGIIKTTSFDNLDNDDPTFSSVQNNLDFNDLLDVYIYRDEIYITGKKNIGDKIFLENCKR